MTGGAFDSVPACFVLLQVLQIGLSLHGFKAVKWVETAVSIMISLGLGYVLFVLLTNHSALIVEKWVAAKGSWGLPFLGLL